MAAKVCINTHEDLLLEVTPRRDLHNLCGWKFVGKMCTKTISGKFGEIWAKAFAPRKFACSYTYDEIAFPPPFPLILKRQRGKRPGYASILRRPCAYSTRTLFTRCKLQCVTAMNIKYISGLLRQRSSWRQKYPATR